MLQQATISQRVCFFLFVSFLFFALNCQALEFASGDLAFAVAIQGHPLITWFWRQESPAFLGFTELLRLRETVLDIYPSQDIAQIADWKAP